MLLLLYTIESSLWTLLVGIFLGIFLGYVAAVAWVERRVPDDRMAMLVILIFAVAFRATLLFSKPILSFDLYRYYWEGKVVANGYNPYLYSADSETLRMLRDSVWQMVSHKDLSTGYPPFMELFLGFVYVCFQSVMSFKIAFLAFDFASIAVAVLILGELGLARKHVIVYAWAPLPILEISQTGHNDSMVIFLVLLSFLLLLKRRSCLSALFLGLSVVTKLYPVFLAPVLFRRWGVKGVGVFLATIVAFYLPFLGIGAKIFEGLLYPVNASFFNGSAFPAIAGLYERLALFANPGFAAQVTLYAIYVAVLMFTLVRSSAWNSVASIDMRNFFLLTGAVLLLNRSLFPWYVIWLIPFLVFYRSKAWMLLSGAVFLSYLRYDSLPPPPYEGLNPQTALLVSLLQYIPFYCLLIYELIARKITLRTIAEEEAHAPTQGSVLSHGTAISVLSMARRLIRVGGA